MASSFKIGAAVESIASLDALGTPCPDPQWEYREYGKMAKLANGTLRGQGFTKITWDFPLIEDAQIAVLAGYISTSAIYIQSKKQDGTTGVFEVLMNVPDPRQDADHMERMPGYRSGYQVEFTVLSEVT